MSRSAARREKGATAPEQHAATLVRASSTLGMDTNGFLAGICFFLLSVSGVTASALDYCPERCDCPHARHLMCANRGLRAVPKPTDARVSHDALIFSLGGNFITNISAFDFTWYTDLVRLNLQYNQIAIIHPKSFEKLSKLEELYLGHNLLTAVPAGTLQPLRKLTTLYGNNNDIKNITAELFSNLDNLTKLRLDGNAIEILQDSVFKSVPSLHYLHLEHNNVHYIHMKAFSTLTNLRFLNLAHNKQSAVRDVLTFAPLRALTTLLLSENEIQHIGNDVFQNLKKLSKLSLSNNRISGMDRDALRGLTALRELLIDGNDLQEIPAGLLDPLQRVEELDLSRNRISSVHPSAFSKLRKLKVLRLKNNFLSSLSGDSFALNDVLHKLDLHGNNWTCDCRLQELKRWMSAAHSQGKLLTVFVQCRYPATLRGKYLDYVNSSQLQPLGNWSHLCKRRTLPEESPGEGLLGKGEGGEKGESSLDAGWSEELRGEGVQQGAGEKNETVVGEGEDFRQGKRDGGMTKGEREKRKRQGQEEVEVQQDQGNPEVTEEASILKGKKPRRESQAATERQGKRAKGRHRSNVLHKTDPSTTPSPAPSTGPKTDTPVRSGERFDLLRSDLPVITDPCTFNRHFITNVSVDDVTSSTATVFWTTREHHHHTAGSRRGLPEIHYRVLYDRFGTPDRFPRYVYAHGSSRSVTLRELSSGVTYMVCVEGAVGGSVCQVAPRDHCAGLVTLHEERVRGASLTSDLQLVTVATLVGNAVLLLVIGGVWLGRSLRRRLQRRKSAVHVRHMYSTRRPFRPPVATASVSTDFTSYQSSRPARLAPLEEGDLIEFPCDRFLDSCSTRRDSDMQRFSH
ncbi:TLR4 interactor with leucine rich repeats [Cololabis saira]|uniref:TLR4 interactor with leucine rich repeats n=1 Tax=Cololabis saira TaxID=129043 RepID=UPI002AD24133|nr:TLR4 interactor with leucine rich repeats [Cololabis saira]